MTKIQLRNLLLFLFIVALIAGLWFVLFKVGPQTIVEALGVTNTLVALFLLAIFGGVSSFTSSIFFSSAIVVAASGVHPLTVGIIGGTGMLIGDLIFYYLGVRGRVLLQDKVKFLGRFQRWLQGVKKSYIPIVVFLYTGFTPLPGDVLSVTLALGGYPLRNVVIPMWIGNITLISLISFFTQRGITLFGLG